MHPLRPQAPENGGATACFLTRQAGQQIQERNTYGVSWFLKGRRKIMNQKRQWQE
jgi:hypothetical protein